MTERLWNIALLRGDDFDIFTLLVGSALKATALLAFVAAVCVALRRCSPATRHLLWAFALCGLPLLPLLSSAVNGWQVPILPARSSSVSVTGGEVTTAATGEAYELRAAEEQGVYVAPFEAYVNRQEISDFRQAGDLAEESSSPAGGTKADAPARAGASSLPPRWVNQALAVWVLGALLLLFRLSVGVAGTQLLARQASGFSDEKWAELFSSLVAELKLRSKVRLLRSERAGMPIVCGVLRPAVLLPAGADEWSDERRRMVLLHELAHVARRDCLTQVLAQVVCALYWFNPLAWYAARQLRVERERACDDYVLSVGTKPSDYAHHLLEIARSLGERQVFGLSRVATVAMARRSQLEGRLLAILDKEGKHQTTTRAAVVSAAALVCALVLPLAAVSPTARGAEGAQRTTVDSDAGEETSPLPDSHSVVGLSLNDEAIQEVARQTPKQEGYKKAHVRAGAVTIVETEDVGDVGQGGGRDIKFNVAEETMKPRPTINVQATDFNPQINSEVKPVLNLSYAQECAPQRQVAPSDYIGELASVGYVNLSVDQLIQLKTHGVTADFIRGLRALGFNNLSPRELSSLRIHRVTPAYVEAMRAAGYRELDAKDLTNFRIHGVTPEYVKTLRDAGFTNLSAKQLLAFRIHRITPEFVAGMRAAGYANLSARELTTLRVMNVTPEFVRVARSRLGDLTVKQLVALKQTGIINVSADK